MAVNFHGDLQYDNIIYTPKKQFKLLDWRQDFAGNIEYGDLYYDLAKLNGGLYVSYKKIKSDQFEYEGNLDDCIISVSNENFLKSSKNILDDFIIKNNYDIKKIEIITGLIFLNMSPMHNYPFSHYIYNLGRLQLEKYINK